MKNVENQCIICRKADQLTSVEHIIPQSLGNEHFLLPRGEVCEPCNNRFARFENRVVSSDVFMKERKRLGLILPSSDQHLTLNEENLKRLLFKMGYEGMYRSRKTKWEEYNWEEARSILLGGIIPEHMHEKAPQDARFRSIPRWINTFRLKNRHLTLEYAEAELKLYVMFRFGRIQANTRIV